MKTKYFMILSLSFALAACSFPGVYQIPIQQGNSLEQEKVDQLAVGQTMSQVKYLLGTPLIVDPLSPGRWDYLYHLKQGDKIYQDVHIIVYFDDQGKVKTIDKVRAKVYGGGKTPAEIAKAEAEAAKAAAKQPPAEQNKLNQEKEGASNETPSAES